jgi:hypothetical protein
MSSKGHHTFPGIGSASPHTKSSQTNRPTSRTTRSRSPPTAYLIRLKPSKVYANSARTATTLRKTLRTHGRPSTQAPRISDLKATGSGRFPFTASGVARYSCMHDWPSRRSYIRSRARNISSTRSRMRLGLGCSVYRRFILQTVPVSGIPASDDGSNHDLFFINSAAGMEGNSRAVAGHQLCLGARNEHRCDLESRLSSIGTSHGTASRSVLTRIQSGTILGAIYAYIVSVIAPPEDDHLLLLRHG